MDPAVVALGGVVAGVVLDQVAGMVRETRRERRAKAELAASRYEQQLDELRQEIQRLAQTAAGHEGVLNAVLEIKRGEPGGHRE